MATRKRTLTPERANRLIWSVGQELGVLLHAATQKVREARDGPEPWEDSMVAMALLRRATDLARAVADLAGDGQPGADQRSDAEWVEFVDDPYIRAGDGEHAEPEDQPSVPEAQHPAPVAEPDMSAAEIVGKVSEVMAENRRLKTLLQGKGASHGA